VAPRTSSRFALRDRDTDAQDRVQWRWYGGSETSLSDFGDPRAGSSYTMCVYGEADETLFSVTAPAASACADCWKVRADRLRYVDRTRTHDGLERLDLAADGQRKSSIVLKARGPNLPPLASVPPLSVLIQLRATNGHCWESRVPQ
jgi:hypothetical protein